MQIEISKQVSQSEISNRRILSPQQSEQQLIVEEIKEENIEETISRPVELIDKHNSDSKLNQDLEYQLIDFIKIKEEVSVMINSNTHRSNQDENNNLGQAQKINFILRELRCRLNRRKNFDLKQYTLYGIIYYDLFSIKPNSSLLFNKSNILDFLLKEEETLHEALKLANSLCNESKGRNYLLEHKHFIEQIVTILKSQSEENEVRQNCIGIIQKLTLKSAPQTKLIELDIIDWIVETLTKEEEHITEYTLEYGLALLMNLSLKKSGRDKCEKQTVIKTILM